jgi:hypothetical protein
MATDKTRGGRCKPVSGRVVFIGGTEPGVKDLFRARVEKRWRRGPRVRPAFRAIRQIAIGGRRIASPRAIGLVSESIFK